MLKETIHHLKDRRLFFSGVLKQLQPGGTFLVVTRPPRPQFPFFEAALDVFEAGQEHEDVFRGEMLSAGFHDVRHPSLCLSAAPSTRRPSICGPRLEERRPELSAGWEGKGLWRRSNFHPC